MWWHPPHPRPPNLKLLGEVFIKEICDILFNFQKIMLHFVDFSPKKKDWLGLLYCNLHKLNFNYALAWASSTPRCDLCEFNLSSTFNHKVGNSNLIACSKFGNNTSWKLWQVHGHPMPLVSYNKISLHDQWKTISMTYQT